jgi:hypothetical protein
MDSQSPAARRAGGRASAGTTATLRGVTSALKRRQRQVWQTLLAWLAAGISSPWPLHAELFAEQITTGNIERVRLGGPDAIAGLGDWAIGNGLICAAVSDPSHESFLTARGGVLIDIGHCGRDDDQWVVLQPMMNLSRDNTLPVEEIRAELARGQASVITLGRMNGLRFETHFAIDAKPGDRLKVTTEIEREEDGEPVFLFGDVALHGHRQLSPFTLSTRRPEHSTGFVHPPIDVDSPIAMARAMTRADLQVLVGGSELEPAISYGWRLTSARVERVNGEREELSFLALNGEHFSIIGAYADTLFFGGEGRPGLLELAQTLWLDLDVGERIVYEREILLGQRADVASVTDRVWSAGPVVHGRVDDPGARLHVSREDGTALTFVRPIGDGRFSFRLPPGEAGPFTLRFEQRGEPAFVRTLRADGGDIDIGAVATKPQATVLLPGGIPMRLIFLGVPPTPTPVLGDDLTGFRVGEKRIPSSTESNQISLAGVAGDPDRVALTPGIYRVLATRGPEWSVSRATLRLEAGQRTRLSIQPPVRVVEPGPRVAADLHVHSAFSDDSGLPLRRRVAAFAAQGADVVVATEHDRVFDYGPLIRRMGLGAQIASVVGVEITSTVKSKRAPYTIGHANAFPVELRPLEYRHGAPEGENQRLRDVAAALRAARTSTILQLNHPREAGVDSGYGSYLTHLAVSGKPFDPTRPLTYGRNRVLTDPDPESGLRDLDFDAIELLNGSSMPSYRRARADWFSLLLQGEVRTGTANSDSHSAREIVALPRNYVDYEGSERGEALDRARFMEAVRSGRLQGSTGPILDVRLGGKRPGQRFEGRAGVLTIDVRAAPWVPVHDLRVFVDGALRKRMALKGPSRERIPIDFERDAFVTVEVEGRIGGPGAEVYEAVAPGFTPFAFTNPIFVDADGDGRWSAPGLPEVLPVTLGDPASAP